jgi:hypothetical protein
MKHFLYFFVFLFCHVTWAQSKRVQTSVDSTRVKIGSQITITYQTVVDTLSKVDFPEGLSMGALEVLESYVVDTLKKENKYYLTKKYGITQWDTGSYLIPSLPIFINEKMFMTDSVRVEILKVAVDTLKQPMFDIKGLIEPKSNKTNWWNIIVIVLIILVSGGAIYYFLKNRKKSIFIEEEINYATPIEKAMTKLEKLKSNRLEEQEEIKSYYSMLTDIARDYIEETIDIPAKESTTNELIATFKKAMGHKKMAVNKETLVHLESVLKQADLVKFAKSKPLSFEIVEDTQKISAIIKNIDESIPQVIEEDLVVNEANIEEIKRRRKTKKIFIGVIVFLFAILNIGGYIIATKGWDGLKNMIFGNPNKELLEGEWVLSTYGNPPIRIETPLVLKRGNLDDILDENIREKVANYQYFSLGEELMEITLTTVSFKDTLNADLNVFLESSLKELENKGAHTILVKDEVYETEAGVNGIKAYGTMMIPIGNSKEEVKAAFYTLLFKQEGGFQQIVIFHPDDDPYASDIRKRIMDSVELGTLK